ncbi:MAG: hypothetical protein KKB37_12410, partial [Alphaproteobacteria bacterium]|nr:hypothetical protein [Alphaproteobacteria bacterium]
AYRERLNRSGQDVRYVFLHGPRDVILSRIEARRDHFMPPGLLDSQLATLEAPSSSENAIAFDIAVPIEIIVRQAIARFTTQGPD